MAKQNDRIDRKNAMATLAGTYRAYKIGNMRAHQPYATFKAFKLVAARHQAQTNTDWGTAAGMASGDPSLQRASHHAAVHMRLAGPSDYWGVTTGGQFIYR